MADGQHGIRHRAAYSLLVAVGFTLLLGWASEPLQAAPFDAERAFAVLQKQCEFGPRVPGSEAHRRCRDYLVETLKRYTDRVTLQPFTHTLDGQEVPFWNILAFFGPEGTPAWLLAAHWDSRPWADRDPDPAHRSQPILGANDGASGVAVLLEAARRFAQIPPPLPVQIVLFDGEDYGPGVDRMFLGSRYYAKHLTDARPSRGILLDMVGDAQLNLPIERYSYRAAPELVRQVWQTAADLGISAFENRFGSWVQDDHLPLIEAGIPCIAIIDLDYSYWHTLQDTPDKCSATSLDAVGRVLMAVVYGEE